MIVAQGRCVGQGVDRPKDFVVATLKLFLNLGVGYHIVHSIPAFPGKNWHIGIHDSAADLDDECKYVLGKEWRVCAMLLFHYVYMFIIGARYRCFAPTRAKGCFCPVCLWKNPKTGLTYLLPSSVQSC